MEALSAAHEAVAAHHGNNYLPLLDQQYRSRRSALFALVNAIELESASADRSVVDAVEFLRVLRGAKAAFVPERLTVERPGPDGDPVPVMLSIDVDAFASGMWRKILRDKNKPGMLVRRHLEVCVFSYLAAELRSGDIAVAGSDSYANLHDQLMSWEECQPLVAAFCAQAGIPAEPGALTAHYRRKLADTAGGVDAGYPSNTDLILEGGRPVLKRRKGAERRPKALKLEAAIHDRLPQRALLDILTRTAYLVGWHHHFGPASGSDPKIREVLARYVLTVFAHGTLLGLAQVAAHMRGKGSVHELTLAGNKHTTASKIEKASATVINTFNKLDGPATARPSWCASWHAERGHAPDRAPPGGGQRGGPRSPGRRGPHGARSSDRGHAWTRWGSPERSAIVTGSSRHWPSWPGRWGWCGSPGRGRRRTPPPRSTGCTWSAPWSCWPASRYWGLTGVRPKPAIGGHKGCRASGSGLARSMDRPPRPQWVHARGHHPRGAAVRRPAPTTLRPDKISPYRSTNVPATTTRQTISVHPHHRRTVHQPKHLP